MKKTHIIPAFATNAQICQITRDNLDLPNFWILVDAERDEVCLTMQKRGQHSTQSIDIPRKDFNKMVRWYLRPQKIIRKLQ